MKYQGAKCADCVNEAGAIQGEAEACRQCRKCIAQNGMPGFLPKNNVATIQIETACGPIRRVIHG